MAQINISGTHSAKEETIVLNGAEAYAAQMPNYVNKVFGNRILVCSRAYTKTNCPTVTASTWTAAGDITTNTRASTCKIRADFPAWTQGMMHYDGSGTAQTTVRAIARVILWNSSAGSTYIKGFRVFQGDPTDSDTYWKLESTADIALMPGTVTEICLSGVISPQYLHDVKRADTEMNMVFVDAVTIKSGTAPKLLYFALYTEPVSGIEYDTTNADIVPPMVLHSEVNASEIDMYLRKLHDCNMSYNLTCPGTLDLVNQSSESSGNLGYAANLYYYVAPYHMLHNQYNSTTNVLGSIWVPTQGMGVLCSDGKWRYRIETQCQQQTSANITITYYPLWFLEDTTTAGASLGTWSIAFTSGVAKVVRRVLTIESATEIKTGFAYLPRARKSGTSNTNMYLYTTLFSVKVVPYTAEYF